MVSERKAETVAEGIYPRIFSHVFNTVTFFIYETKIIKLRFIYLKWSFDRQKCRLFSFLDGQE